jgi:hypothetical protein
MLFTYKAKDVRYEHQNPAQQAYRIIHALHYAEQQKTKNKPPDS